MTLISNWLLIIINFYMSLAIINYHEAKKIVAFLDKTFQQQKINNAVIGVSGGIDSTVSLFLLTKILPKKNIIAVHLPYYNNLNNNINLIAKTSGVNIKSISIKMIVDNLWNKLKHENIFFETIARKPLRMWQPKKTISSVDKIRLGNIMARVRMIILFDLAKKNQALVCGTENKSEHLLGYFTRFGDAASDIEPIQHLYKTQVFQLAKVLGVPDKIISQKPSANLWKNQTDEKEFGFTYKQADKVLSLYFDQKIPTSKIIKLGYINAKKIIDAAEKNAFKQKTPYIL